MVRFLFGVQMLTLYGIPNCNTVKKARAWLDSNGIDYTFHDFKKNGVSQPLLDAWLQQQPWERLVNRTGLTWRGLPDAVKASISNNNAAMQLMLEKPSVIKRPVMVKDEKILSLGFVEADYNHLLK
jgi:Spx/MgsR family transcriptional regulator